MSTAVERAPRPAEAPVPAPLPFDQQLHGIIRLMRTAGSPRTHWSRFTRRETLRSELLPELRLLAATVTHAGHGSHAEAAVHDSAMQILSDVVTAIDHGDMTSALLHSHLADLSAALSTEA